MKKTLLTLLILILALTACGGSDKDDAAAGPAVDGKARLSADYSDALPVQSQLALGSMKLAGSDQAIDATLASEILPLWQAYQSLGNSDTAAEAELNALLNQIQDAMQPAQVQAIAAMKLTTEDVTSFMEERGTAGTGFRGLGANSGEAPAGGFGGGRGGGIPGQRPPGGGGFGGGEIDPAVRETRIAEMDGQDPLVAFADRILVNTLVTDLQLQTGEITEEDLQQAGPGRFWEAVSEASGVDLETLQTQNAAGVSVADAVTAAGGDLEAARAALTELFSGFGNMDAEQIQQRVDSFLNDTQQ